jgi:glycosyltransferase involved in cell wall biosynthesis
LIKIYPEYEPIVSIIMPTFNRANYIERAIKSVLNQNFKKWELIIVDDGSSDATFGIVEQYIKMYENIRYMKHSNRKTPLATNAGIMASCGDFISFLGSDDEYKPEFLQQRVDFMLSHPNLDFIHGGVDIIGSPFVKDKNDLSRDIHISECAIGGTFFGKCNVFFELAGFKNLIYSDDSDFLERVQKKFNIFKVDFPTYVYYRDTPDSICSTIE